jgi:hypothetical protein
MLRPIVNQIVKATFQTDTITGATLVIEAFDQRHEISFSEIASHLEEALAKTLPSNIMDRLSMGADASQMIPLPREADLKSFSRATGRHGALMFAGAKRSGKDTAAAILSEEMRRQGISPKQYAFADTMKAMIASMLEIAPEDLEAMKVDAELPPNKRRFVIEILERGKTFPYDMRKIMQFFGTEGIRGHLGEDFWIRETLQRIVSDSLKEQDNSFRPIISDLRFLNELKKMRQTVPVISIGISREHGGAGISEFLHASEREIKALLDQCDFKIENPFDPEKPEEGLRTYRQRVLKTVGSIDGYLPVPPAQKLSLSMQETDPSIEHPPDEEPCGGIKP